MTPYYERGGVTIYCGEALAVLESLPDESVDAIIADPPYSSGGFTRSDRNAEPTVKYVNEDVYISRVNFSGDNRDGRSWAYWSALWMSECLRIVKHGGYLLSFTDWRQLPLASDALQAGGFIWRGVITWDKGPSARAPHTGYFRHQCEYLVWGTKGTGDPTIHAGPWPGCYQFPTLQSDKFHLTGKPTPLLRSLVQCCPVGGLVLDPFLGSGTTAVACQIEGRRCIGIERILENCLIAANRLRQEVFPLGETVEPQPAQLALEASG